MDDRRHFGTDHDLLVRIDERLGGHLMAFAAFVQQHAQDQAKTDARLESLETSRADESGAARVNAQYLAAIISCSSALTAIAVWIAGHVKL